MISKKSDICNWRGTWNKNFRQKPNENVRLQISGRNNPTGAISLHYPGIYSKIRFYWIPFLFFWYKTTIEKIQADRPDDKLSWFLMMIHSLYEWMNEWVNFFNEEEFCKANWKHFSTVLFLNSFRSFFPSFEVGFRKRTLVSTLRSIIQIIGNLFKSLIFSYLLLVTCLPMFSCRFGSYLFKIKCLGVFRKTRRSPIHFINQFKWISFLREKKWIFIFRHNFIQWWIFSQNYEK